MEVNILPFTEQPKSRIGMSLGIFRGRRIDQCFAWKGFLRSCLFSRISFWKSFIRSFGRNTAYFHNLATACKKKNKILMLKDDQGNWVEDQQKLKSMRIDFFSHLHMEDGAHENFWFLASFLN